MIALLFPGQGAQRPGMLHDLHGEAGVERTFAAVSTALGRSVLELDTATALSGTVAAQLALFTAGVASTQLLVDHGVHIDAVAGHSIGAFAAAVAAGAITIDEGVVAVRVRAERMRDSYPSGFGLAALLGARLPAVQRLVAQTDRDGDLFVAMENAVDQIVLAGSDAALGRAQRAAARFGVREVRRLDVAVPSHCPLLAPVAAAVHDALADVPDRPLTAGYVAGTTARVARTSDAVRQDLADGVQRTVRWRDSTDLLAELGTDLVLQASPGSTTSDLFRTAHPDRPVIALDGAPIEDVLARIRRLHVSTGKGAS